MAQNFAHRPLSPISRDSSFDADVSRVSFPDIESITRDIDALLSRHKGLNK
jgi:hypothetical protein